MFYRLHPSINASGSPRMNRGTIPPKLSPIPDHQGFPQAGKEEYRSGNMLSPKHSPEVRESVRAGETSTRERSCGGCDGAEEESGSLLGRRGEDGLWCAGNQHLDFAGEK